MGMCCSCGCLRGEFEDRAEGGAECLSLEFEKHLEKSLKIEGSGVRRSIFVLERGKGAFEEGRVLCVDLGGNSLKIAVVCVDGEKKGAEGRMRVEGVFGSGCEKKKEGRGFFIKNGVYLTEIPKKGDKIRDEKTLYEWIGEEVFRFRALLPHGADLPRRGALTFSFPLQNNGRRVEVVRYTKNARWKPVEGPESGKEEPLKELNRVLGELVRFEVIVNDAMAAFLSGLQRSSSVALGVVVGTGTNGAYLEDGEEFRKKDEKGNSNGNYPIGSIVNTEWGGYSGPAVAALQDEESRKVDADSSDAGRYIAEKMVGGIYFKEWVNIAFRNAALRAYRGSERREEVKKSLGGVEIRNEEMEEMDAVAGKLRAAVGLEEDAERLGSIFQEVYNERNGKKQHILAGFISAIIRKKIRKNNGQRKITVNMNGSGCASEKMRKELKKKIEEVLDSTAKEKIEVELVYDENASLTGAAYALVMKSWG